MNKLLETEMLTSLATIILFILCIVVFIAHGAYIAFYLLAAITLIVGLVNAWIIAKGADAPQINPKGAAKKGKRSKK